MHSAIALTELPEVRVKTAGAEVDVTGRAGQRIARPSVAGLRQPGQLVEQLVMLGRRHGLCAPFDLAGQPGVSLDTGDKVEFHALPLAIEALPAPDLPDRHRQPPGLTETLVCLPAH